jgi:hypothetical protein
LVTIAVYLPDDGSVPQPLGEASAQHALTHCIQDSGSGRVQVVTMANVSQHIDLALQLIGESVRIAGSWATVNGQRMSSLVALWNRLDCYRQSLDAPDPPVFCASKAVRSSGNSGLQCGVLCGSLSVSLPRMHPDRHSSAYRNRPA